MKKSATRSLSIASQESYSAVMIEDLVADVAVNPETTDRTKPTKEVTNLAYDGHLDGETTSPAVDDSMQKSNGAGISKGVILNAMHFGQNDSKLKTDEKAIQLKAPLPVPAITQQNQCAEPKGFKDMSLSRKIVFGFSFLPSVLFVLCFAIILPCNVPKPCIEEVWVKKFNDTEATSGLEIPDNVVFTALSHGENVLFQLNKNNGKVKEIKLEAASVDLKCGEIIKKDKKDCIIVDDSGKVYSLINTFNDSYSKFIWDPVSDENYTVSNAIILSGCKDNMENVALAVSPTNIKVMYSGDKVSTFAISECDSVPIRLMPWMVNGSSNIVFICEKDGKDKLVSVPKNVWCAYRENSEEKPIVLMTEGLNSLKKSNIQPLENSIVVWSGNEASLIQPDGTYLWNVFNISHSEENRFIMYGNFYDEKKQLAFFSSNLFAGLTITLLDPTDGSVVKSIDHSGIEATEMIQVHGTKKDYALILLKKTSENIVTTALSQINDISTTIVSLVSNEPVNNSIQRSVSEELAILDLEGNIDSIKELKDGTYKSTIKAVADKDSGVLSIYFLSTLQQVQTNTTEVRNINVANWDKSTKSKCKI